MSKKIIEETESDRSARKIERSPEKCEVKARTFLFVNRQSEYYGLNEQLPPGR